MGDLLGEAERMGVGVPSGSERMGLGVPSGAERTGWGGVPSGGLEDEGWVSPQGLSGCAGLAVAAPEPLHSGQKP